MSVKKYTNSKNKQVSPCFLDNDAFKALIDGKNEDELLKIAFDIEQSAIEVENNCNERIAKLNRSNTFLSEKEGTESFIAMNNEKIESIQETIDSLQPNDKGFVWWKAMVSCILEKIGEE